MKNIKQARYDIIDTLEKIQELIKKRHNNDVSIKNITLDYCYKQDFDENCSLRKHETICFEF